MTFAITKKALVEAMGFLAHVVEKRNTIPILSNVRMVVEANRVTLTATDLDIEVQTSLDVTATKPGHTTIQTHMLYDIARKIADGANISLSWDDSTPQVTLAAGRARFKMQSLPGEDFPDLSAGDMTTRLTLPAATLALMLGKVGFAISTEETRYYLCGIYLHHSAGPDGGRLVAVATDGHRLSRFTVEAPAGAADMPGVIIPAKTVSQIARLLKGMSGDVELEVSPHKCRLRAGHVLLTSKLIDGTFPDYERVIPRQNQMHMLVKREGLSEAVERVSIVSAEKSRALRLDLAPGTLTLGMNNADAGTAEEEVVVDYKSSPLTIGLNSTYVDSALNALGGDDITASFNDPGSPSLWTSDANEHHTVVIMPMRV